MNAESVKSAHTFVILAYRESPYLEDCILSLLNQQEPSTIILATSTPNAFLQILADKYKIPVFINRNGGSIAKDWSFAFSICTTRYLTLTHQDDIYYSNYTFECLSMVKETKDCIILFTDYDEIFNGEIRSSNLILFVKRIILFLFYGLRKAIRSSWNKKYMLAFGSPISCPTVMFNKEIIGNFTFSEEFSVNLDWDAWRRLVKYKGAYFYNRKHLMAHRIYKESQTSIGLENNARYEEDKKLFESFWPRPIAIALTRIYKLSYKSNTPK